MPAMLVVFHYLIERSCRFSTLMIEESAESFESHDAVNAVMPDLLADSSTMITSESASGLLILLAS